MDLNPVLAKIAESLEDSRFTSTYDRIMARKADRRRELPELEAKQLGPEQLDRSSSSSDR